MAENEKKLIEAAAVMHDINPEYANAFLDGVKAVSAAMRSVSDEKDGSEAGEVSNE